ncbi:hypothetical protein TRP8649_01802 [Pelagimonas phthalicica]|uniref:Uncharacterized protein n=1 Tax=Pelagimonas phthalicica TaxID=1037362 RepID=A0A238JBE1_9RHOB|nr:hypothetical protein CLV87_0270 [Pelagimonas phthalicica]SMX27693.1 hypothetical protein TRP8649_01802 [Pelagimonas phthalicica]
MTIRTMTAAFVLSVTGFVSAPQTALAGDCCILKSPQKGTEFCVRATGPICQANRHFSQFKPKLFCRTPGRNPPDCVQNKPKGAAMEGGGDSLELSAKYLEMDPEELKEALGSKARE